MLAGPVAAGASARRCGALPKTARNTSWLAFLILSVPANLLLVYFDAFAALDSGSAAGAGSFGKTGLDGTIPGLITGTMVRCGEALASRRSGFGSSGEGAW